MISKTVASINPSAKDTATFGSSCEFTAPIGATPLTNLTMMDSRSGHVPKSVSINSTVPDGYLVLAYRTKGAVVVTSPGITQTAVVGPGSVSLGRPGNYSLLLGRGDHEVHTVMVATSVVPGLDAWLKNRIQLQFANEFLFSMCAHPRFERILPCFFPSKAVEKEMLVLGMVHEVVAGLLSDESSYDLTPLPSAIPDTIQDLIRKVRQEPQAPWPLKDAADIAGYSPFHFSRVFKSMIGYGFHEYVDRSRTELAVKLLAKSSEPVDGISAFCGFGTTQGLRESLKEYLGLVPTEIRPS